MTVSEILQRRLAIADAPPAFGPLVSFAAHAAFVVLLVLVSRPRPVTLVPVALPVRVVSPASLPGRPQAAPAPAPTPLPEPAAKPKRVIEKLSQKPVPSASAMPDPLSKKKAPPPVVELPAAGGNGASEGAGANLSFGTSVAALDVDFPFAFYVEQLLNLIGANWLKPEVADGTTAVVSFRIERDGRITEVRLMTPSGVGVYDRAAVRAVYSANPLPPLPPEFPGEHVGVHLRFR